MGKKTILYISGDGHSGTTLLDILLGAHKKAFSTGELFFLSQKGIKNKEYCSCGTPVPECEIWSSIIKEWEGKRILKLDEYIRIQYSLTSIKNIFKSIRLLKNPSGKIKDFIEDTDKLYNIIFNYTQKDIVIDSSKSPLNILILKNLSFDVKIIHLIRRFGDVLNSNKKKVDKNLEAGVEHDITPEKTYYVLLNWIIKNVLTIIFSKNLSYHKIRYEDIVSNPQEFISEIINGDTKLMVKLNQRGPFYPRHLVAGNAIRMKEQLYIAEKPMNTSYSRLKGKDKLLARCIDFFY